MRTKDIKKDRIAVILSVYRNDSIICLKECIESLRQQTVQGITVFIGVDGPIGEEMSELFALYEKENVARIIRFEKNRGLAAVLNDLIEICKSEGYEYLARMDADDISVKNRIELQVDFLKNHPEVDVVGGAIEEIDEKSELRGKKVSYPLTHEECKKYFGYRNPMAHPTVMFRRSFFDKVKGYRNEYRINQDTMIWLDGFLNGCIFANIPETVLYFRVDDSLFKGRRHGWKYAKRLFKNRMLVNKELHYGVGPFLYAIAMFVKRISPVWLIKIAYKYR